MAAQNVKTNVASSVKSGNVTMPKLIQNAMMRNMNKAVNNIRKSLKDSFK